MEKTKLTFKLKLETPLDKIKDGERISYDIDPDDFASEQLFIWKHRIAPIITGLIFPEILPGIIWHPYSLDIKSSEYLAFLENAMAKTINATILLDEEIEIKFI